MNLHLIHQTLRVAAFALLAITVVAADAHAATDSDKCAAAKMKAASKYAGCRLGADAKAKATGEAADYTKCNDGQLSSWSKIEGKYPTGCTSTLGDQAAVQADVASATSCVATELAGPTGSCDTSADLLCGNGIVDPGEVCDQSDLGAATCNSATSGLKAHGTLRCGEDCQEFDTSECVLCPADGAVVDGQCWVLGALGLSCVDACAASFMSVSSATLDMPAQATTCGWILGKLGSTTAQMFTSGPTNVGCWTQGLGDIPRLATAATQLGSYSLGRRACACE